MYDLTTPDGVEKYMSEATSETDWNSRCDEVKKANGGYPVFWYPTVIASGLLNQVRAGWVRTV